MIKQAVSAFAAAAVAVSFASAAFAEDAKVVEKLPVANFKLTNTADHGATIDEDNQQIVLTYTSTNPDKGNYTAESYLKYTAPADGTVTFEFEANRTCYSSKNKQNNPRIYWTYANGNEPYVKGDVKTDEQGGYFSSQPGELTGNCSLSVTKNTVYYIYGYSWFGDNNHTTYTLTDFKFTSEADITEATPYSPKKYDGTDKGFTANLTGSGTINWYAKSKDAEAYSKIGSDNTVVSGNADYVAGLIISGIDDNDFNYEIGASIN